jgi:hypothetical protein
MGQITVLAVSIFEFFATNGCEKKYQMCEKLFSMMAGHLCLSM